MDIRNVGFLASVNPPVVVDPFTEVFTTPGTHSWESPVTGVVRIRMWAGGGAGGQDPSSGHPPGAGGGAFSQLNAFAVVKGQSYDFQVGRGGSWSGTTLTDSTDTWWASTTIGKAARGLTPPLQSDVPGPGGASADGVGDVKYSGGNGASGAWNRSGGGGSSAGHSAGGSNGSGCSGGTAPSGGGDGGTGHCSALSTGAGGPGSSPGGGGAAARSSGVGGAGGNGRLEIDYAG